MSHHNQFAIITESAARTKAVEWLRDVVNFLGQGKVQSQRVRLSATAEEAVLVVTSVPPWRPHSKDSLSMLLLWPVVQFILVFVFALPCLWYVSENGRWSNSIFVVDIRGCYFWCTVLAWSVLKNGLFRWEKAVREALSSADDATVAAAIPHRRLLFIIASSALNSYPLSSPPTWLDTQQLQNAVTAWGRGRNTVAASIKDLYHESSLWNLGYEGWVPTGLFRRLVPQEEAPVLTASLASTGARLSVAVMHSSLFEMGMYVMRLTYATCKAFWECLWSVGLALCAADAAMTSFQWVNSPPFATWGSFAFITLRGVLWVNTASEADFLRMIKDSSRLFTGNAPNVTVKSRRRRLTVAAYAAMVVQVLNCAVALSGFPSFSQIQLLTIDILALACESVLFPVAACMCLPFMWWAGYPLDMLTGSRTAAVMSTREWVDTAHECAKRGDLGSDSRCAICWDRLGSPQQAPGALEIGRMLHRSFTSGDNSGLLQPHAWQADPECIHLTSCGHAFHATCMLSAMVGKAQSYTFDSHGANCPLCNKACAGMPMILERRGTTAQTRAAGAADALQAFHDGPLRAQVSEVTAPALALAQATLQFHGNRVTLPFTHPAVYTSTMGALNKHALMQALPAATKLMQGLNDVVISAKAHLATLRRSAALTPPPSAEGETAAGTGIGGVAAAAAVPGGRRRGAGARQGSRGADRRT